MASSLSTSQVLAKLFEKRKTPTHSNQTVSDDTSFGSKDPKKVLRQFRANPQSNAVQAQDRSLTVAKNISVPIPLSLIMSEHREIPRTLEILVPEIESEQTLATIIRLLNPDSSIKTESPNVKADFPDLANHNYAYINGMGSGTEQENETLQRMKKLMQDLNDHDKLSASDPEGPTFSHSHRVAYYAIRLAEHIEIGNKGVLKQIALGGVEHDAGKLKVPKSILNKEKAPEPEEWKIIKNHPEAGIVILKQLGLLSSEIIGSEVLGHHVWENPEEGKGRSYPNLEPGEKLALWAKIVHVADVYDATTCKRSYRKWDVSPRSALKLLIRGEEKEFNPYLVRNFVKMQGYDYDALRKEIEIDKVVLKQLIRGIGAVYNNNTVGDLITQNLYNRKELTDEMQQEPVLYSVAV